MKNYNVKIFTNFKMAAMVIFYSFITQDPFNINPVIGNVESYVCELFKFYLRNTWQKFPFILEKWPQ